MKRLQHGVLAVALAAFCSQAVAEQTMIVLDASGSMWGQINGKPKLQIAREALATVLEGVPADMELGLIAYGHRKKGDCSDIELIVEPAAGTGPAIAQAAAKMKFLGKTPLSAAVKQAAEALRYTEEKATVILITDGLENCKADPCALGNELAKQGIDFTAHVVGFDLTDAQGKQVACLAENTGGQYLSASNADELHDALLGTVVQPVKKAVVPEPEKEQPLVLPQATLDPDESAAIGSDIQVKWTGPNVDNDYIDIVPQGYKETNGELSFTYTKEGSPLSVRAPGKPGEYTLRYIWRGTDNKRHVLAEATIQITDSEVALVAPDTVQAGSFITVGWKGPANQGDYIDLVPKDYKKTNGELAFAYAKEEPELQLRAPTKPGDYQIRYMLNSGGDRRVLADIPLVVTEAVATLSLAETVNAGSLIHVFWTGPAGESDYIDLVPADHKKIGGELDFVYTKNSEDGETIEIKAPTKAGDYMVRYILRGSDRSLAIATQPLTVNAADASVSAPDSVQAGSAITVDWSGPAGKDDYIDLVPADYKKIGGELAYVYTKNSDDGKTISINAPTKAGPYQIRYILRGAGKSLAIASHPITVNAATASVSLPDSVVAGKLLTIEWAGPAGEDDYIDLVPADYKKIGGELAYVYTRNSDDGTTVEMNAPTKAGQYQARYILRGSGKSVAIATQVFTVNAATASLSLPDSVPAGSPFTVEWTGPAGKEDYIDLVPADYKKIGGELTYFYTRSSDDGLTGELKAPKKTGQYLVRYILRGSGPSLAIASHPLTVTKASDPEED